MMFWLIYFFSVLIFSHTLSAMASRNYFLFFVLISVCLITPAQIEVTKSQYAPSLLTFIYNVLLEKNYSMRVLRPLALSLPLGLILVYATRLFKKRFFRS